ncbi:MAG: ribosome silencing factor [Limnochordia bacterium]|nr:ribosome silencing factor [Limnochordia bacterium]
MLPEQLAQRAAMAAFDKKAENVCILDLSQLSIMCDYFVICTGQSDVSRKAIADNIEKELSGLGRKRLHREGEHGSGWVLIDYGDVIVHIFSPEERDYYGLERLWGDAKQVEVTIGSENPKLG